MDPLSLEELFLKVGVLLCKLNQYQIWEVQRDKELEVITIQRASAPAENVLLKIEYQQNDPIEYVDGDLVGERCIEKHNMEAENKKISSNYMLDPLEGKSQQENETRKVTSPNLHSKTEEELVGFDDCLTDAGEFDYENHLIELNQTDRVRKISSQNVLGQNLSDKMAEEVFDVQRNHSKVIKTDLDSVSWKTCSVSISRVVVNGQSKYSGAENKNPLLKSATKLKSILKQKKKRKKKATRKIPVKKNLMNAKTKQEVRQDPDYDPETWNNPEKPKPEPEPKQRIRKYPIEKKDGMFHCLKCPFSSPHNSVVYKHCVRKHMEYSKQCFMCPMKFKTESALVFHSDFMHNDNSGKHICHQCKKRFTKESCLRFHQKSVHNAKLTKVKCGFCSDEFFSTMARSAHRNLMHKDKLFFCQICFQPRASRVALTNHLKVVHESVPSPLIKCRFCSKEFYNEENLHYHEDEYHEDEDFGVEKEHVCEVGSCQKKFRKESLLLRHSKIHLMPKKKRDRHSHNNPSLHEDTEDKSPCTTCGLLFTKSKMNQHLKTNHLEKSHRCQECGKEFTQSSKLKIHRAAVHKKIKISCPMEFCGKVFSRRECLKTHLQHLHVDGEKVTYKCNLCEKSFAYKADLNVHIRAVHEGKTSPCSFCGKEFFRPSERNRHEKQVHNAEMDSSLQNGLPE